jgi:hypothetical protein
VTCNTFERGVTASQRGGVSYGIYQKADANVTLDNPNPNNGGPLLKNRFDDARAGNSGFYAIYNANSSATAKLNYYTFFNYSGQIASLVNAQVELLGLTTPNIPDYTGQAIDCAPQGPNGLPRPVVGGGTTNLTEPAYLRQNAPNPASGTIRIAYHLPANAHGVTLMVQRAMDGQVMIVVPVPLNKGEYDLSLVGYAPGTYFYSLLLDGRQLGTKRVVVQ